MDQHAYETHLKTAEHQFNVLQHRVMKSMDTFPEEHSSFDCDEAESVQVTQASPTVHCNKSVEVMDDAKPCHDNLADNTEECHDNLADDEMWSSFSDWFDEACADQLQTEADFKDQPPYYPYTSWPAMLLRQWKLSEAKTLSSSAFNNLLRLIFKLVTQFGDSPELWPKNLDAILSCENKHVKQTWQLCSLRSGVVAINNVAQVIQMMFANPQIFNNLHFEHEDMPLISTFWTAQQWQIMQRKQSEICPDSKLFPLIGYSDKTRVLRSRAGHSLHPIVIAPAGVPREIWKKHNFKFTIAYMTADADIHEVLEKIVSQLSSLEQGRWFLDPFGQNHFLCVGMLVWLGDHPELNDLAWVYCHACRRCHKLQDEDGEWIMRTTKEAEENWRRIKILHHKKNCKGEAQDLSQKLGQHYGMSPLSKLKLFDVYEQTPACPGHSENQGRTLKHLWLTVKMLDSGLLQEFQRRLQLIPKFPGLMLNFGKRTPLTTLLTKEVKLTSDEAQTIRSIALFLFVDLIPQPHQVCWREHVDYATAYYKKAWTDEERAFWTKLRYSFLTKFESLFQTEIDWEDFPKGHDPHHDDLSIERFGSFLNLDEMNFESCNHTIKEQTRTANNKAIDLSLLAIESTQHQLSMYFGNHTSLYQGYLHSQPKKEIDWAFKGKPRTEIWDAQEVNRWKLKLLCEALGQTTDYMRVEVFHKLRTPFTEDVIKVAPHKDQFDVVLVRQSFQIPWLCVREFFRFHNPLTNSMELWMLASSYTWFDPQNPIDFSTGCPHLAEAVAEDNEGTSNFVVLPVQEIWQKVHVIPDWRKNNAGAFWVNWWVTFGSHCYPEQHRFNFRVPFLFPKQRQE
eukprot:CAMPEP_0168569030 /NCGR_PEP_ID=MMETSP0413-20121227/15908_1 /TAXON_ID=136452 /ORGANISM="Filamoeba nolandi, Strain NC-AS-23-1" /LENGTH=846 /DNA_ID=CAMNT_0008601435 /DNA_START=1125 /DNA_END=3665 /DNA_ORIENTATION=-